MFFYSGCKNKDLECRNLKYENVFSLIVRTDRLEERNDTIDCVIKIDVSIRPSVASLRGVLCALFHCIYDRSRQ